MSNGGLQSRRKFIAGAGAAGASFAAASRLAATEVEESHVSAAGTSTVPRRRLGKTGSEVSIIGLGGFHLGSAENQEAATHSVQGALDAGINFFDKAWEYHDHKRVDGGPNDLSEQFLR